MNSSTNKKRIIISLVVIFTLFVPFFVTERYLLNLINMSLIYVILAQGLNILQGYTGYVSIAQATFFGIGAYISSLVMIHAGLSFWISLPIATIGSGLVALIIGIPIFRTTGHYFAIVTMSLAVSIWIIMMNWSSVTGGDAGITKIPRPEPILSFDFNSPQNYYYLILFFALLTILFVSRLVKSKVGRAFISIRENEELTQSIGISLTKYKVMAFALSGTFGGLAGSLYAHYINYVNPAPFAVGKSLDIILAVIIGGSGTIVGPIIGAFLVTFLPEMMRMADEYRLIIYALLLILITIYMPRGLVYLIQISYERLVAKIRK